MAQSRLGAHLLAHLMARLDQIQWQLQKDNKSNFASQGAALCRTATASLHFESQAKFKGVKP